MQSEHTHSAFTFFQLWLCFNRTWSRCSWDFCGVFCRWRRWWRRRRWSPNRNDRRRDRLGVRRRRRRGRRWWDVSLEHRPWNRKWDSSSYWVTNTYTCNSSKMIVYITCIFNLWETQLDDKIVQFWVHFWSRLCWTHQTYSEKLLRSCKALVRAGVTIKDVTILN